MPPTTMEDHVRQAGVCIMRRSYWCTIVVLLVCVVYTNLLKNVSVVVEEFWTCEDLSSMAGSSTMAAAVSYFLASAEHGTRSPKLKLDEITALIDTRTAGDIRTAIFMVSDSRGGTSKFDRFARTANAAATCSTTGTAGALGLDACLARCEKKTSLLAWTPRKEACYMLCALATSPCTKDVAGTTQVRPVSWGTKATDWRELPMATMKAPTMMSVVNGIAMVVWMVSKTEAVIVWMAFHMEAMMTRDNAWTTMKVVFLLWVAYKVRIKTRAARARRREMKKDSETTRREMDQLKLDQMFENREVLLNEDGLHPLHFLGAWVIDQDSVDGGQRLAPEGQLPGCSRGPSVCGRRERAFARPGE